MKNFKVAIKTDRENCLVNFFVHHGKKTMRRCKVNHYKPCNEKNCPFKEVKK